MHDRFLPRRTFLVLSVGALVSAACGSDDKPSSTPVTTPEQTSEATADLLITGGTILTLDPKHPRAEALAVKDGVIVKVGAATDLSGQKGPKTRVIDLAGGLAVPGLTDAHGHVANLGRFLEQVDLRGARSIAEVVDRIKRQNSKGTWILGRGWDQNLWPDAAMPTHHPLTAAFPDRPVWLRRVDGHAGWGNAAVLEQAGITAQTSAPEGGEIFRDDSGTATGVFVDAAMGLVPVPAPSRADIRRWILAAQDHLHARGITGVHDMGVDADADAVYRELLETDELHLRIHGYASEQWFEADLLGRRKPDTPEPNTRYALLGVKVYADGALGSRGAYLLAPYRDRPGHRGLMQRSKKNLARLATHAMGEGWQMATHAIGDGGNRATLDAYERAFQRHRIDDHRFRIEHCQIVDVADVPRFVTLKVLASMQPTHATSDMSWVADRIGDKRLPGAYAWQRLLKTGAHLAFGSDFPVELADVTHGLYAAITRQDEGGHPSGGWLPDQRVDLERAIRGFSSEAAYFARREKHLGRIAKGMQADLTCFKQDLFALEPGQIRNAEILATVVAGRVFGN